MDALPKEIRDLIWQLEVMPRLLKYEDVVDILGVGEQAVGHREF